MDNNAQKKILGWKPVKIISQKEISLEEVKKPVNK